MGKKNKKKGRSHKGGGKPKKKQTRQTEAPPSRVPPNNASQPCFLFKEPHPPVPVSVESNWRVIGLVNLTNTCYFNSALQLLLSSVFLQEVFSSPDLRHSAPMSSLTAALCELYNITHAALKGSQFKPNKILGMIRNFAPSFKSRGQHDAHELLITMLHHLVEEAREESGNSWMDVNFNGKLMSTITCNSCHYTKLKEEEFLVLSVSVVKDGKIIENSMTVTEAVSSFPLVSNDVTPEPVTETVEVKDVVERHDPGAKLHLDPSLNVHHSGSLFSSIEVSDDDVIDGLQDLFAVPYEFEDETDVIDDLPNGMNAVSLSDSLTESLVGLSSTDGIADSVASMQWNDDSVDDWMQYKGKGKGKKGKKGKRQNRFEGLQLSDDEQETIIDVERFQTIDACLFHFFSPESVTWRCSKEYPEKKVTFNNKPEVFILPPTKESRSGNWKSYVNDMDLPETSSEEETTEEASAELDDVTIRSTPGLKSCLKTDDRPERPPVIPLNSVKRYRIWKAPKILCIHLKRFEAVHRRGITKLQHRIQFESELDIAPYMDPTSPHTPPAMYELRAVVCHSGSVNFGHYTAFVSRKNGEEYQWYDVSDTSVRKASMSDVLKCQAYILLFEASEATPCASV